MQKGVFLPPRRRQRRRCKEEAGEWEAVHSQLFGSVGAGGSCLERIWGTAVRSRSLAPACSRRGERSCGGSRAARMHPQSSSAGGTCLPLALVGVVACVDGPWLDGRQLCVPPRSSRTTLRYCREPSLGVQTWSSQGRAVPWLSSAHTNRKVLLVATSLAQNSPPWLAGALWKSLGCISSTHGCFSCQR